MTRQYNEIRQPLEILASLPQYQGFRFNKRRSYGGFAGPEGVTYSLAFNGPKGSGQLLTVLVMEATSIVDRHYITKA